MADANSQNGSGSSKSKIKLLWLKVRKPLKVLLAGYLVLLLFALLLSFPSIRAIAYPLFGPTGSFNIVEPNRVFTTKENPDFYVNMRRCSGYTLNIFKASELEKLNQQIADKATDELPPPDGYFAKCILDIDKTNAIKPVSTVSGPVQAQDWSLANMTLRLPNTLPPGDYIANLRSADKQEATMGFVKFQVTDLGAILKYDNDKVMVSTVSLIDRKPWPNADINLRIKTDNGYLDLPGTADASGITVIKRPANIGVDYWNSELTVTAKSGENVANFRYNSPISVYYHSSLPGVDADIQAPPSAPYRCFFTCDRPVYRLGQTISFKGLVRKSAADGIASLPAGTELTLDVTDPTGNTIKSTTLKTDVAGAFQGNLNARECAKTGQYRINIHYPDQNMESFPFQIEQYRKPDFKVEILPSKSRFVSGEKVRFKVQANYFFGAPLKNAKIRYKVSSFPDSQAKNRLLDKPAVSNFFSGWPKDGDYGYPVGEMVPPSASLPGDISGELTTDGTGQAFVEVDTKTKSSLPTNPWNYDYDDSLCNVSIETTDLSRKTFTADGSVPVSQGEFAVFAETNSTSVKAGDSVPVTVRALDYNRQPVKGKKVKVKLGRWLEESAGKYKLKQIDEQEAVTDEGGRAKVSFATTKTMATDTYYVNAECLDDGSRTIGDVTSVTVLGSQFDDYQVSAENEQFRIELDKDFYKPSETVRAVIRGPVKKGEEAHALVSVEGMRLHEYKVVTMHGPVETVEFPIQAKYVPNAYICGAFVAGQHRPILSTTMLRVTPEGNFADLKIATDKAQYQPGETIKYTVTARRKDGSAVSGMHLNASVVDEGIYAVWNDLLRSGTVYDAELKDIFQSIFKVVENIVQTRISFDEHFLPEAQVQPVFDGYGLLVLHGPLLHLFGQPPMVCTVDCMAVNSECAALPPPPAPAAMPAPKEAQLAAAAPPPPAGGGGAGPRPPSPRVRSNFADAAAWYPSLVTDASGTATFSVKLPDDLTTWRATVNGITSGIEVGGASSSVVSTQPFLARLALPRFYTQSDETVVSALINNLSNVDQQVTVTLNASSNIEILEAATVKVSVPKGEQVRQSWKIKVVNAGEAKLNLKAIGGTLADAEERKLPVSTFGYRVFFAKNGIIKDADSKLDFPIVLPDDAKLATGSFDITLASSAIGPVLGSFEKLIDYPYGCTEQTLSRMIPSVVAYRLNKNLGVPLADSLKAKFAQVQGRSLEKLTVYHHGDGGWGWWKDDESNPYMTAHVLEGLYHLQQAGVSFDPYLIESALSYLSPKIISLSANPWERFQSEDHAKMVYVMSLYKRPLDPLTRTWQLLNIKKMSPEALAYLTLAFKNVNDKDAAGLFYARLKELRNDSNEYCDWDHTKDLLTKLGAQTGWDYTYRFTGVETTALALRATVAMEPANEELLDKISRWLVAQHDENGWDNTKCTASVFLALLEKELSQNPNRTTDFKVGVEALNKMVKECLFQKTFDRNETKVSVPITDKPPSIRLTKNGPGWLYYNSMLAYDRPLKPGVPMVLKSVPSDLKIQRQLFRLVKDEKVKNSFRLQPLGDTAVKSGEVIMMMVTVDSPISVPYVLVEAALPSGGEVVSEAPNLVPDKTYNTDDAANWYWWTHQDILDDRIAFFANQMPAGKSQFRTFIRMEIPGTLNLNPVHMEAMYTDKVHGRSQPHSIHVVE